MKTIQMWNAGAARGHLGGAARRHWEGERHEMMKGRSRCGTTVKQIRIRPNQTKSDQIKPNPTKSNQIRSNQTKSDQTGATDQGAGRSIKTGVDELRIGLSGLGAGKF
jgi:hypothetical protein